MYKEGLDNKQLITLDTLPKESFHLLSYPEQLVVVQNSVLALEGYDIPPLRVEDVDANETKIVNLLLRPDLAGPFASTWLENRYAWYGYLYDVSPEIVKAFEYAVENNLWVKYLGMTAYEPRKMGEIVHAVSLITSAYTPHRKASRTVSSADYLTSYANALDMHLKSDLNGKFLVVGAFSIKSISDIWALGKYVLDEPPMVIDIDGLMTKRAVKHYELDFVQADGLAPPFIKGGIGLIITNNIVLSLCDEMYSTDYDDLRNKRFLFFQQASNNLHSGGVLIMVEEPLRKSYKNPIDKEELDLAIVDIQNQLIAAGFEVIYIKRAESFVDRNTVERFIRTGIREPKDVMIRSGNSTMLVINARKK